MKRMISMALLLCCFFTGALQAQDKKENRRENMRAEMVAYFTAEVDLTPAEAEKFWPVFNEAKDLQHKTFKEAHDAYKALAKGIKEGKTGAEIAALTDAYLKAQEASNTAFSSYLPKFRSILSEEKVARVFMAEEKFRREQIHKLRPGEERKGGERKGGRR